MICPKCKLDDAHRSHSRGLLEKLARLIAIHPHRCHKCNYRFLKFRFSETATLGPSNPEIKATRRAMEWRRTRRGLMLYGGGLLLFAAFLYFLTRERGPSSDGN